MVPLHLACCPPLLLLLVTHLGICDQVENYIMYFFIVCGFGFEDAVTITRAFPFFIFIHNKYHRREDNCLLNTNILSFVFHTSFMLSIVWASGEVSTYCSLGIHFQGSVGGGACRWILNCSVMSFTNLKAWSVFIFHLDLDEKNETSVTSAFPKPPNYSSSHESQVEVVVRPEFSRATSSCRSIPVDI